MPPFFAWCFGFGSGSLVALAVWHNGHADYEILRGRFNNACAGWEHARDSYDAVINQRNALEERLWKYEPPKPGEIDARVKRSRAALDGE